MRSYRLISSRRCAQRLAASPEKSPSAPGRVAFRPLRAQRLAASPEKSRCTTHPSNTCEPRAQRLAASPEKSRGRKWSNPSIPDVLNASRHHRKNRRQSAEHLTFRQQCSTPRGITGKIAHLCGTPHVPPTVLNASRHHRKNRFCCAEHLTFRQQCSTPRGITGKIAIESGPRPRGSRRAQRLATSPEKSLTIRFFHSTERYRVLNASRHHRKNRFLTA